MKLFVFSHIVQIWLLPPGFNLLLSLIGFVLWRYCKTLSKILIIFSFVSLWLLSTPLIAQALINKLQLHYPALTPQDLVINKSSTAIVILGGGDTQAPEYGNTLTVSDDSLSRLSYAAYLYHHTHFPIIVSGGKPDGSIYPEANIMSQTLKNNFNITAQLEENMSVNTHNEAQFMVRIMEENKINTVYVVTNAWHMPRSMYAFNSAFSNHKELKAIPAPMGYIVFGLEPSILNYLPNIDALNANSIAIHEYIGILWYHLYYGILGR